MDIITAFANSRENPLPNLKHEEEELYRILTLGRSKKYFDVANLSFANTTNLSRLLRASKKRLKVFWYSGHAGSESLFLEDNEAYASGLYMLLKDCSKLKLIVLNGCATQNQVERLLQLPSRPAVIVTQADVTDKAAAKFGTTFMEEFAGNGATIKRAYEIGLAAAQLLQKDDISSQRGLGPTPTNKPLWGLYGDPSALSWTLPRSPRSRILKVLLGFFIVVSTIIFYFLICERDKNLIEIAENDKVDGNYQLAITKLDSVQEKIVIYQMKIKAKSLRTNWEEIIICLNEGDSLVKLYQSHNPDTYVYLVEAIDKFKDAYQLDLDEKVNQLDSDVFLEKKVDEVTNMRDDRFNEFVNDAKKDISGGRSCRNIIEKLEIALILKSGDHEVKDLINDVNKSCEINKSSAQSIL